jgi:flagellar motor component MotA
MEFLNIFTAVAVTLIAIAGAFPVAKWLGTDRLIAAHSGATCDPYRTMNDIVSLAEVQDTRGHEAIIDQANGLRNPTLARAVRGISQVSSAATIRAHMERELFAPLTPATPRWVSVVSSPMLTISVGIFCMIGAGAILTSTTVGVAPITGLALVVAATLYALFMAQAFTPVAKAANNSTREILNRLIILEGVTALAECQPPAQIRARLSGLFPAEEAALMGERTAAPLPLRRAA